MRAKIVFCCLVPFLMCLGIFFGDAITAKMTPKARANPLPPCPTASAIVRAWDDPLFPARERFIKFRVDATCAEANGWGCSWTAYQTIWKSDGVVLTKVFEGTVANGNECDATSFRQWTNDFATWGVGLYKVDIEVYDDIPIIAPTLLKFVTYTIPVTY